MSDAVLAAVRRAVETGVVPAGRDGAGRPSGGDRPALEAATKAALDTLALAHELGIEPDLDRAQELVYDTVRSSDRPDLADLAQALGLSPALFAARPEDEVQASA